MARLKLKVLEQYLQTIDGFRKPKLHLEQYVTSPHVASHLLFAAETSFADLNGRYVADLGCGCGTLTFGAAALGASCTVGFEIDLDAVDVFRKNAKRLGLPGQWNMKKPPRKAKTQRSKRSSSMEKGECNAGVVDTDSSDGDYENEESDSESGSSHSSFSDGQYIPNSYVDLVLCDVTSGDGLGSISCRWHKSVDTVVMNPPFGTKNNHGADMAFLKSALGMACTAVYTLHKSSTRSYVLAKGKEWGGDGTTAEVLAQLRFDLPKSYRFHNKKSVDVEVDFIRFGLSDKNTYIHNFSKTMKIS